MDNLFEYRRELDTLHFTPEQKAQLTARVLHATGATEKRTSRRPLGRMTLVAAVVVLALAVTAGATVYKLAGDSFAPVFGTAQTEIIDKIGHPIDAATTDGDMTITADAILGDKYNACIIFTLTNADGSLLTLPEGVEAHQLLFAQQFTSLRGGSGQHGSAWFIADDEGVRYVSTLSADSPLKLGRATAEFQDLQYYDEQVNEVKTLAAGSWKLKFQVDYQDSSLTIPAGQSFSRDGLGFTVTDITLSPVALQVKYTADSRPDWGNNQSSGQTSPEMSREQARYLGGIPLLLTLRDGTTLDMQDVGGSINPTDSGAECTKGTVFSQIVPLEDVVSITVGDVVIPVSQG